MGFRARKSISITKGVRLNVSKTGVGVSVGGKGMRYSAHSSGRRTTSVGVPGSGLSWQSSSGGGSRQRAAAPAAPRAATPGMFAPKGEKALHKALMAADVPAIEQVAHDYPDYRIVATFLVGMDALARGDDARATQWLQVVADAPDDIAFDGFVQKYLIHVPIDVEIAPGVVAALPINRSTLTLMLAEALQAQGNIEGAIEAVEAMRLPTSPAALSLAELYVEVGRYDDVVDITNSIENQDDLTALLNVYRGVALRELGHHDAAREAFKEALRSKKRSDAILHRALSERAETYLAQNRTAQARKDLERILAADANYPGVRDRLAAISAP